MSDQGTAYVMQDALLPSASSGLASGVSDLLPVNTHIFSSTVRLGRPFYIIAVTAGVVGAALLAAGVSPSTGSSRTSLVAAAFGVAGLGAIICGLLAWRAKKLYDQQLRNGEWHEGVIVFASGDVVVRFTGVCAQTDRTIESVYLSRADVERRCAWRRCGLPRSYLRIYHMGIDARPSVLTICETDLRDSVHRIAEHINDLKSKNISAF